MPSSALQMQSVDEKLRVAGFDVEPAKNYAGFFLARRGEGAVLLQRNARGDLEVFRNPGLYIHDRIFRVLDRGYQKFLTDDEKEIPATAEHLKSINAFYEELKSALGLPVLFNESLGALTAVTYLDSPVYKKHS